MVASSFSLDAYDHPANPTSHSSWQKASRRSEEMGHNSAVLPEVQSFTLARLSNQLPGSVIKSNWNGQFGVTDIVQPLITSWCFYDFILFVHQRWRGSVSIYKETPFTSSNSFSLKYFHYHVSLLCLTQKSVRCAIRFLQHKHIDKTDICSQTLWISNLTL